MYVINLRKKIHYIFYTFIKACGELADDAKVTIPDELDVLTIVNQFGQHLNSHQPTRNRYSGENFGSLETPLPLDLASKQSTPAGVITV